jgi:hypothetical protein
MKNKVGFAVGMAAAFLINVMAQGQNCSVTFTDCNGGTQTVSWICYDCTSNGRKQALCAPVYTHKNPGDTTSCIQTVAGTCGTCVMP